MRKRLVFAAFALALALTISSTTPVEAACAVSGTDIRCLAHDDGGVTCCGWTGDSFEGCCTCGGSHGSCRLEE